RDQPRLLSGRGRDRSAGAGHGDGVVRAGERAGHRYPHRSAPPRRRLPGTHRTGSARMTKPDLSTNRFPAGTFTPAPRPNTRATMLAAQTRLELILLLRNGEQLLLTMLIPITLLIGLTLLPFGDLGTDRVDQIVPAVMMVAVMSTAFTGQAIAVGFDRRYGALKRLGATALPKWGIVAGKSAAVLIVVVLQALLLGLIGAALGWRPEPAGLLLGAVVIALGTATFATMGLLL